MDPKKADERRRELKETLEAFLERESKARRMLESLQGDEGRPPSERGSFPRLPALMRKKWDRKFERPQEREAPKTHK